MARSPRCYGGKVYIRRWSRSGPKPVMLRRAGRGLAESVNAGRRNLRASVRTVKLEAENARLRRQLEQTQGALDVMGKAHRLLELLLR